MTDLTLIAACATPLPATPQQNQHLINGAWAGSADGATFDRISPSHKVA